MHIFKILGTCGQSGLQKKWSNLHLNPALNENTQDWGGFFGIVFLCYCGSVVAAIRSSPKSRGLDLKSTGPMCRILGGPWTWMRKKKVTSLFSSLASSWNAAALSIMNVGCKSLRCYQSQWRWQSRHQQKSQMFSCLITSVADRPKYCSCSSVLQNYSSC